MGHSDLDPAVYERRHWNAGRNVGAKRALKPRDIWAIRFYLDEHRRDVEKQPSSIGNFDRLWPRLGISDRYICQRHIHSPDTPNMRALPLDNAGRVRSITAIITQFSAVFQMKMDCAG